MASGALCAASPTPLQDIVARVDRGDFAGAQARIEQALRQPALGDDERRQYEFERERMRRIRLDFGLDREQAMARVRRQIPDLREEEFDAWDRAGLIEHLDIDGQRRWFNRAPSNLFRLSGQAAARRAPDIKPPTEGPYETLAPHHGEVLAAAREQDADSVAPRRLQVTQSIKVKADAVPAGETVRAWIPYPRAIPGQQERIVWHGSVPEGGQVAPEDTLQRTVYLEREAVAGVATEFSVSYELTVYARHVAIDPDKVQPTPADPALAPYLQERAPHVVFTPALREFSRKVVGTETHPYRVARKLFDAVDRIPWAGAREYSTLSNISDYALHAGHADCGQQTLLLIALLRLNGIPARWQSGMVYSDNEVGYSNLHDWGQLYLAPYGWVPMDVTTGALDSDDPALRDFYLGGLDAYRIAFNDDFAQPLVPAKRHFRSETVDSQRGEVEWAGGNLYFDQWSYDFQWQVLPLAAGG
ncbi:transglutaminase domain-containing protein [Flavobacterium sp. MXW15]|uniref:Transglutaminase domain-containing protein n=1 Tax=Xanthomonas chitinilytica TaxID=2989819 RepID=A0ABT3JYQ4_9XANT|nr:transglutaminase domain-containing protein [Xanthomonas sp. H13-6]MCW4456020.1 transglutaminase domain-containing protein [Flavobacterium sp. MXW15]MCW4473617.1 transglutaminase domain-containing protein [Xanthomonas sp. H13-6]